MSIYSRFRVNVPCYSLGDYELVEYENLRLYTIPLTKSQCECLIQSFSKFCERSCWMQNIFEFIVAQWFQRSFLTEFSFFFLSIYIFVGWRIYWELCFIKGGFVSSSLVEKRIHVAKIFSTLGTICLDDWIPFDYFQVKWYKSLTSEIDHFSLPTFNSYNTIPSCCELHFWKLRNQVF